MFSSCSMKNNIAFHSISSSLESFIVGKISSTTDSTQLIIDTSFQKSLVCFRYIDVSNWNPSVSLKK